MKPLYIMGSGEYSDFRIEGVYSSKEKALEYFESEEVFNLAGFSLFEFELLNDAPLSRPSKKEILRRNWNTEICIRSCTTAWSGDKIEAGSIYNQWEGFVWASPTQKSKLHDITNLKEAVSNENYTVLWVSSFVSQEHADKIAATYYKKFKALLKSGSARKKPK